MNRILRSTALIVRHVLSYTILLFSYCTPRFSSIWIFGCRIGQYYQDNSRFLFEFVCDNIKDIHPIWITRNQEVYDYLRSQGRSVYMMLSLKGIFYSLIAKAAIICVNHDDLLKETIGGARIIHLWHATQIKSKPNERLSYDNRKFTGIINAQMQRMDLITVSSKNQVDLMSHVLNIDKAKIRITGYPKTDCLIDVPEFDSIKDCFRNDIPFDKKIILYLPTYRNQHFNLEYDLFDKYGFDCDETEDLLKRHNAILLYIPHYFIKVPSKIIKKWGEYDSLYIYEKTGPLFDINLLHPYVDILITDYSSVFTNYSILNKPIVFAKFDYDYFIGSNSAIGFVYDDITPGPKAENWAEVCHYLERFLNSVDDYHDRRIQISKEFHNFQDGKNCERAYREINRLIEG